MKNWIEIGKEVMMPTYAPAPIVIDQAKGCTVTDIEGKEYLDFVAGIAVNSLGGGHPKLVAALQDQVSKLLHVSNLYWTAPSVEAAQLLAKASGMDQVFFCNSGAEAVEGAIKLARKSGGDDKYEIIAMNQSFHGRTFGAMSATGQLKYQKGYAPLVPGIIHVPFMDLEAVKAATTDKTVAVLFEVIQGEGGIHPVTSDYYQAVQAWCKTKGLLMIIDEVQTGNGRTGSYFAYQQFGERPDIVATAKGLGGGLPIGAVMATKEAAANFKPGDHATTFGGNPMVTRAAATVLTVMEEENILENVQKMGAYLKEQLLNLKTDHLLEVRGMGLMLGAEFDIPAGPICKACAEKGLLLVGAGANVIRFVPPLVVTKGDIDRMIAILQEVMDA
ncbi:acetylornithine transaminase [Gottschalkiaceae bacterium SANA]|nr:acetylornithine transaminase [Gottschalkiaceae bacterium SANA]